METKKNPRADLTRKTGFFFSIALLITMSLVLFAFELKQHETPIGEIVQRNTDEFENIDVPLTEITPPPPPAIVTPIIVEVQNDEEIEKDIAFVLDLEKPIDNPTETIIDIEVEPEATDEIVSFAEVSAAPIGGWAAFYEYLGKNIKYPSLARRQATEGKVFVQFVVNRDGSIVDVTAIKGIGHGCDEEAVRVVSAAPKFSPGKQRGKPVRQKMVIPVSFVLGR